MAGSSQRRWRETVVAALVPLTAATLTIGGLAAWTASGRAGSPADVSVEEGRVFLPLLASQEVTGVFFTVDNRGGSDDQLVAVSSDRGVAMLSSRVLGEGSGRMTMLSQITAPAGGRLEMSPFTPNVMLDLDRPLAEGDRVEFTLTFRQSGQVKATAVVVPLVP